MKNNVEVDYGRNSVAPRPYFSLLSSFSLNFSQCKTLEPITQPPARLFIAKDGIRGHGRSPRWAVASTWSNLARPGELVTSPLSYLGAQASQGSEKGLKWPFCPPFWVFLHSWSKTWNGHLFRTVTDIQHHKLTNKDQKMNDSPRTKLGYGIGLSNSTCLVTSVVLFESPIDS